MSLEDQRKKNIPWVEKYRPQSLSDVIAHEEIIQTIQKFREEGRLPNLLLYGPPGTGKTSTIISLAHQMYGTEYQHKVLELNASDERGIGTVRESIKRFAESQSISFGKSKVAVKLIILDEADAMTSAAQFALRRIIEKFSKTTRFCFICNYVSKIIPALQSRCTRFKFKQIPLKMAQKRIVEICTKESITIDQSGIDAIFKLCDGDMRRVVNMLQALSLSSSENPSIDQTYVYKFTGMAHPDLIFDMLTLLINQKSILETFNQLRSVLEQNGVSLQLLIKELDLLMVNIDMPDERKTTICERMSEIEYRLSINCSDQIQMLSLIGVFYETHC